MKLNRALLLKGQTAPAHASESVLAGSHGVSGAEEEALQAEWRIVAVRTSRTSEPHARIAALLAQVPGGPRRWLSQQEAIELAEDGKVHFVIRKARGWLGIGRDTIAVRVAIHSSGVRYLLTSADNVMPMGLLRLPREAPPAEDEGE